MNALKNLSLIVINMQRAAILKARTTVNARMVSLATEKQTAQVLRPLLRIYTKNGQMLENRRGTLQSFTRNRIVAQNST